MGYRFHSLVQGDANLPPLLFLHGFLGSCRDFDRVIPFFVDRFRCLTIDLPGHGKTLVQGGKDCYSMPATAAGVVAWLTGLGVNRCHLVGYSMGGRLALYLAIHYPETFSHVVLESASPGLKTVEEQQTRSRHDWALADQLEADFPAFLARWYEQPLFASLRQHSDFRAIMQERSQNHPQKLAKSLRYMGSGQQPSLWENLPAIQQPLLLVVGEHDRKFCAINQEMAQRCPTAQLAVVPDCGQIPHLENPQLFATWLNPFLTTAMLDAK